MHFRHNSRQDTRPLIVLAVAGLISMGILTSHLWSRPASPAPADSRRAPAGQPDAGELSPDAPARLSAAYGKLPLSFEANQGQSAAPVKFLARGSGYNLFLTASGATLALGGDAERPGAVVHMQLAGADPAPRVEGLGQLPGRSHYFIGNDPAKWRADIPSYAQVKYREVYPGIDLVYYGNQRQLEYDFIVAPGADPRAIRLSFAGADKVEVDAGGDLILRAAGGDLRQHKPVIYQEVDGERREIASGYRLSEAGEVTFEVAAYDPAKPLVIDPVLVYSTYLGGGGNDRVSQVEADASGSVYVVGTTSSDNFPTENAAQPDFGGAGSGPGGASFVGDGDAFVARLNADGSALIYSTYFGGSRDENGIGLAIDSSGAAYISGRTNSENFPTLNAMDPTYGGGTCNFGGGDFPCFDAYAAKLNGAGMLVYSTYLGGNTHDDGRGIAVDSAGSAYVVGNTQSLNFPTQNALQPAMGLPQDGYVTKLSADGSSLVYSTYLGGTGSEAVNGITVDADGNAYVTGPTDATDFPTVNAVQPTYGGGTGDAFMTKLNAAGASILFSTYLGGTGNDLTARGITLDAARNVYVLGRTSSTNFPVQNALQPMSGGGEDAFVVKLAASGSPMLYSTYLGGSGDEAIGSGLSLDPFGNIYASGSTNSPNFPTRNPLQANLAGGRDAFVTVLNAAGSALLFSTYFGGAGDETGNGLPLDAGRNFYIGGRTTSAADFPLMNALQPNFGGGSGDAYIAKISALADVEPPQVSCTIAQPSLLPPSHDLRNVGLAVTATDNSGLMPAVQVMVFGDEDDEEPTGDGNHSPDARGLAPGALRLRAERKGDGDGRVYLIVVKATDASGNMGVSCCVVVVPKNETRASIQAVNAQAAAARAFCEANGTPPPGYFVIGDGPIIGPKQ